MTYTIYNKTGKPLRTIDCSHVSSLLQAKEGEYIMKGLVDDVAQKIEFDGFDKKGQPINPRVVDKTAAEILADNPTPPEIPFKKQMARTTNEQWQDILKRLDNLEKKQ